MMRRVQVILEPLDLSKSNGKKKTLINTNILTNANKIVQEFGLGKANEIVFKHYLFSKTFILF